MDNTTITIILLFFTCFTHLAHCQLTPIPTTCSQLCSPTNVNKTAECGCHLFSFYDGTNATRYRTVIEGPCTKAFGGNSRTWVEACPSVFPGSSTRTVFAGMAIQIRLLRILAAIGKQCDIGGKEGSKMLLGDIARRAFATSADGIPFASRLITSLWKLAYLALCYIIHRIIHLDPSGICSC